MMAGHLVSKWLPGCTIWHTSTLLLKYSTYMKVYKLMSVVNVSAVQSIAVNVSSLQCSPLCVGVLVSQVG